MTASTHLHSSLQNEHNPHHFLGLHKDSEGQIIRLYRPFADEVYLEVKGKVVQASKKSPDGIFEYRPQETLSFCDYRVYHNSSLLSHDPYAFSPTIGEMDAYLFNRGVHYKVYEMLGAKVTTHQSVEGVKFALWAPNAKSVSLIADFNHWDGRVNPMRSMGGCGVWELFIPGLKEGEKYKFEIRTQSGSLLIKADPYAFASELRPKNASVVANPSKYIWKDAEWMQKRIAHSPSDNPMIIYEIHLGSWKKEFGEFVNYRTIATTLVSYVKEHGFTHVEFLPLMEHPLDESWGYQVTGFYAVTSRYGSIEDFQFLVDILHQNGIGVIVDWVPAHFPEDHYALKQFDGSFLYEHEDPRQGFHPHWNTLIFNYGRKEVSNFLIGSALYWLEKLHVDGIRVDAVASMLYLDYGRSDGEWVPNAYGGKDNLEAIEFLKHLNAIVHERFPGAIMCAEESTSYGGVTHSLPAGGMGFDFKWNMGWMNDTLSYFSKDPLFRKHHHNQLTFGLLYAFSEKFILPFSHDEVVHGKKSLLSKMPGDDWQKFAGLRLLYSYMICQPGKKLLFMGSEIGVWKEWAVKEELDWNLLQYDTHKGIQTLVKDLNHFYKSHSPFWEKDGSFDGFDWIDFNDVNNSVVSYLKKGEQRYFAVVHNFTPNVIEDYFVRLSNIRTIEEVFNTDHPCYGGSGVYNKTVFINRDEAQKAHGFTIRLPPLATCIFEVNFVF